MTSHDITSSSSDIEKATTTIDDNDAMIQDPSQHTNSSKSTTSPWQRLIPRILAFVVIGLVSLMLSLTLARHVLGIELPHTLEDVKNTATHLEDMASTTWSESFKVASVFAALYLWQQAFSIPGSVLFNLLSGHLYGIILGTLWTSFLTALGATFAYGLAMLVAEPFLELNWVSRKAAALTRQMRREPSVGLFWWLLFIRLFPFTPYWFINMVSPFLNIPIAPFFWSTFLGSMPYNFICAQAGAVLGELSSTADIFSVGLVIKLLLVSLISLVPVVWGKKIKSIAARYLGRSSINDDDQEKEDDDMEMAEATATTSTSPYTRIPNTVQ